MLSTAPLEAEGAGAGGHVAEALADQRLGQHGGGGGAVTRDVVGLGGDLLHELGAHVLEGVLQLDLTSDGDAVVGDRGGTELLVEHHVAALRAERDLDGVGQGVHAGLEGATGVLVELQDLGHGYSYLMTARTSRALRMRTSSPSAVISVPPYLL
jgi:hypothetical protein